MTRGITPGELYWMVLASKITVLAAIAAIALWIGVYSRLATWWRNPIGRSLVEKSLLLLGALIAQAVNLFLPSRYSLIIAWAEIGFLAFITPVMLRRSIIWLRLYKRGELPPRSDDPALMRRGCRRKEFSHASDPQDPGPGGR